MPDTLPTKDVPFVIQTVRDPKTGKLVTSANEFQKADESKPDEQSEKKGK